MIEDDFDRLLAAARDIFDIPQSIRFTLICSRMPYPGLNERVQLLLVLANAKRGGSVKGYNACVRAGLVFA